MKKMLKIIIIILLISIIVIFALIKISEKQMKAETIEPVDAGFNMEFAREGIKLTMLGGSNMEEKGNINSMGYFIITIDEQLIFIDGGRDIDAELVKSYIDKYGNGKVDHWFITHPHSDHVGALLSLLVEENNLEISNLYCSLLKDEWYEKNDTRGYETAHAMLEIINSSEKIKNIIQCKANQTIQISNTQIDIIRVANEEIINSEDNRK